MTDGTDSTRVNYTQSYRWFRTASNWGLTILCFMNNCTTQCCATNYMGTLPFLRLSITIYLNVCEVPYCCSLLTTKTATCRATCGYFGLSCLNLLVSPMKRQYFSGITTLKWRRIECCVVYLELRTNALILFSLLNEFCWRRTNLLFWVLKTKFSNLAFCKTVDPKHTSAHRSVNRK